MSTYESVPSANIRRAVLGLALCLLAASGARAQESERAVQLYEAGRYPEARQLLQRIDAAGQATGPLLYRLSYCEQAAGETARSGDTLQRAITALEGEAASSTSLEVPFYLVNAYQNAGRGADARRVAAHVTARVESGELTPNESGLDKFRMGKLYADQDRVEPASSWYAAAIEAYGAEENPNRAYVAWAGRYLAERAISREDLTTAESHFSATLASGDATRDELDRLATLRARLGKYEEAAEAWRAAERAAPADADRARYCWRLALLAAKSAALPETSPSGQAWTELTQEQLETLLDEQARTAREAVAQSRKVKKLKKKLRKKLQPVVDEARGYFLAAALEYAVRGHNIRERAFFNGFAPLVFHEREWILGPR